jgi:MtN3 and saliva related transmembrane protein
MAGVSGIGVEAIGWSSSALLVVTLVHQVRKQWKSGHSEGVSRWLFLGQLAASGGFMVYSAMLGSWVFSITNALLIVNALVGYAIVRHHRKGAKQHRA